MIEEGIFPKRTWHYDAGRGPTFHSKYDKLIVEAAKKFDVDAALISAVIKAESDFNPRESSNKGARGLTQLMPATAERFGVVNAFDAKANINGGVRYLRWLLDAFEGNADLAVAAYTAGEGNVWKYNGVPPFRETITYINRVARAILPLPVQRRWSRRYWSALPGKLIRIPPTLAVLSRTGWLAQPARPHRREHRFYARRMPDYRYVPRHLALPSVGHSR